MNLTKRFMLEWDVGSKTNNEENIMVGLGSAIEVRILESKISYLAGAWLE